MAENLGFYRPGLPSEVNFPLCMAPMVGLSHCAFRQLVREYLPKNAMTLWPSEMLNSRRIPDENLSRIPEAMKSEDENFWVPQILANEEEKIRLSLIKLYDWGAQGVDINMGCPVRRALKHNYGVSLMGDPRYASEVVEVTVKYSPGPVSVKLRGVEEEQKGLWIEFVRGLAQAGADWICLHPRTAEQKRKGRADWSQFEELRRVVDLAVIGNGDIQCAEDAENLLRRGTCDMVMAGRALTARPWMFWQLGERLGWEPPLLKSGRAPATAAEEGAEYGRSLFRLLELMETFFSERLILRKFIFHVKVGAVWLPFGHHLYSRLARAKNLSQLRYELGQFFAGPQLMYKKTELRE